MNLGDESEIKEFKESLSQLDKGLKSLTAMMNKHYSGDVFFGVKDNGDINGLTIGTNTDTVIRTRIKELIQPNFIYQIFYLDTEDGKRYIQLHGDGSDVPYSCDGRYYIRNAKSDDSASNEILKRLLISENIDLLKESVSRNQGLTFNSFYNFLKSVGIDIKEERKINSSYQLYAKKGEFNNLALLLSDQNPFSVKVVTYDGSDKTKMIQKEEFGQRCLLLTVKDVLDYFKFLNKTKVDLTQGARIETTLFDYASFREAWVNACVHNNWFQGNPPSVYIYDDRIEIVSYGYLPFNLSIEEFFEGRSIPVNRSLFDVFLVSNFCEQSGHGVNLIVSTYGEKAFDISKGMIKVTIPFSYETDEVISRKRIKQTLTRNQAKVLDIVLDNPEMTINQIAGEAKISLSGAKKIIEKLCSLLLIKRVGSKKTGRWVKF